MNLDIERARFAYATVAATQPPNAKEAKNYRNELRGAGTLIQQLGLAQTLAYYAASHQDRQLVRKQILTWLAGSHLTSHLFGAHSPADTESLYLRLLECNSSGHRLATNEAIAVLLWLKRFAEGRWDSDGNEVTPPAFPVAALD